MDNRTIFTKTAKGLGESIGKTKALSRDARKVIIEVNGVASFEDLYTKLGNFSEEKLTDMLAKLKADDYIREFNRPPVTGEDETQRPVTAKLDDALTALTMGAFLRELEPPSQQAQQTQHLDGRKEEAQLFKTETDNEPDVNSRAHADLATIEKKSSDAQAHQKAEARIKKDAEEFLRRQEDARKEKARKEKDAEDKAWRKFEAKAKADADALVRQTAEALAEQVALEKRQREAKLGEQERERMAAEEHTKKVVEEKIREEAELKEIKEKKEAQEFVQKLAEAKKEREAEDKAWRKFEAKAKKEAEDKARLEAEKIVEVLARQAMEDQAIKEREEIEKEAETKRKEAEVLAQKEAQLREKMAAEENVRREAEQLAEVLRLQKAEARQKKEAQEKTRRDLEIKNRKEAIELARQKAQVKKDAEELARREAQAKIKEQADALARLKAEQQKELEEQNRRQAEERHLQEIAEKLRFAVQAQAEQDAAEQAQQHALELEQRRLQEMARLDAEKKLELKLALEARARAKAKAQAEQRDQEEVARQARLLAEIKTKQESDKQDQAAAQDIADKVAEEFAREKISEAASATELAAQQIQEQARLNAITRENEKARQEAAALSREKIDERNRQKIEQKRKREAERKAKRHIEEIVPLTNRNSYGNSRSWGMSILGLCFVVVVALFAWAQLSNFDEKIAQFEKVASAQLQQKVKLDKLHFAFFPQPQWQLEGVVIGDQGQIKVPQINAVLDLGELSGDGLVFKVLEFQSPVLNQEGLSWLLFGRAQKRDMRVDRVIASNATFDTPHINVGLFDVEAAIGVSGAWEKMTLQFSGKDMNMDLLAKDGQVQIKLNAKTLAVPFGATLNLGTFSAEGVVERNAVNLSKFYGVVYDGILTGNARLTWDKYWVLKGDVRVKQIDMAKWQPELFESGEAEGNGKFIMQARETSKLFATQRLNGHFMMHGGTIRGVDLVKQLQGADNAGTSSFNELTGWFSYEAGRIKFGNVILSAGLVSANGHVDVAVNQDIDGRFAVNLDTPARNAQVDLVVSGSLKKPRFDSTTLSSR